MDKYYFRCRTNPTAPLLVLTTDWEAREMRTNPDYDRVDEDGLPVVDEDVAVEQGAILFQSAARAKK